MKSAKCILHKNKTQWIKKYTSCIISAAVILGCLNQVTATETKNQDIKGTEVNYYDINAANGESIGCGGGSGAGIYRTETFDFSKAYDSFNVQNYKLEDSEKDYIYDCEYAMRRDSAVGEAWIVFETMHIRSLHAETMHLPEDVAPMEIMVSTDGSKWDKIEVKKSIITDDNKWTTVTYDSYDVEKARFVKFIWGTEDNLQNWWNPYFVDFYVEKEPPYVSKIDITTGNKIVIPMYDAKEIQLNAVVTDQIGIEMEEEVYWEIDSSDDDSITISDSGKIVLTSDLKGGTKFTVMAWVYGTEAKKTFVLCDSVPGDTDGDCIITDVDINCVLENYGQTVTVDNRACDADKNGVIDIIDLCYCVKYKDIDFYKDLIIDTDNDNDNDNDNDSDNDNNNDSDNDNGNDNDSDNDDDEPYIDICTDTDNDEEIDTNTNN